MVRIDFFVTLFSYVFYPTRRDRLVVWVDVSLVYHETYNVQNVQQSNDFDPLFVGLSAKIFEK